VNRVRTVGVAVLVAVACGGPQKLGGAGSTCFRDDDCAAGMICVAPTVDDIHRVCSSDPTPLISMVEGPPPTAVAGAAGAATAGSAGMGGMAGVVTAGSASGGNATGGSAGSGSAGNAGGGAAGAASGGTDTSGAGGSAGTTAGMSGSGGTEPDGGAPP